MEQKKIINLFEAINEHKEKFSDKAFAHAANLVFDAALQEFQKSMEEDRKASGQ